jgi:membrane protein YdbS with pleckstrin-like domain
MAQTATVTETVEIVEETVVTADGEQPEPEAAAETPAAEEALAGGRSPRDLVTRQRVGVAVGAAGAAGMLLGAAVVASLRASRLELWPGEEVTLSVRPRRALLRYAASLGFYELHRRATRFTVTDQRLLIQEGLVKRVTCAVPLRSIRSVSVRSGPLEGYVNVHTSARHRSLERAIGPLRSPTARRLADAIAAQRSAAREGSDG